MATISKMERWLEDMALKRAHYLQNLYTFQRNQKRTCSWNRLVLMRKYLFCLKDNSTTITHAKLSCQNKQCYIAVNTACCLLIPELKVGRTAKEL